VVAKSIVAVMLVLLLTGCASIPDGMNVQFGIDFNPSK
jgi:starvation-inducible outer membrane lipoprotein